MSDIYKIEQKNLGNDNFESSLKNSTFVVNSFDLLSSSYVSFVY